MSERMVSLAKDQRGFIDVESVRDIEGNGITISYWESLEAIKNWKANLEHLTAQKLGREKWYAEFKVRICKVEREYKTEDHGIR
jgi:heme-degrading monooxygenase HmoA